MEFTKEMAQRLRMLCVSNIIDVGDLIEDSGLSICVIDHYLKGDYDIIEIEHLRGLANAFYMPPDELYEQLKGNKPLKGRFGTYIDFNRNKRK